MSMEESFSRGVWQEYGGKLSSGLCGKSMEESFSRGVWQEYGGKLSSGLCGKNLPVYQMLHRY